MHLVDQWASASCPSAELTEQQRFRQTKQRSRPHTKQVLAGGATFADVFVSHTYCYVKHCAAALLCLTGMSPILLRCSPAQILTRTHRLSQPFPPAVASTLIIMTRHVCHPSLLHILQREWEPKAADHLGSEEALAQYHMQVTLALKAVEDDIQSKFRVEQRDVALATVRRG